MGIFDLIFGNKQTTAAPKRSGYLAFYDLWDWYDAQPKEVQDFLYISCGYGIGTDSRNLIEGNIEVLSAPGEEYPWTATKFLCQHAMNAAQDKNQPVCKALIDGAFMNAKSMKDSFYQGMIAQKIQDQLNVNIDQKKIDEYRPILYQLVKDNPGMLQSEIKKRFPPDMENIVGLANWHNCQDGRVRREKKGRSFQLWAVEEV